MMDQELIDHIKYVLYDMAFLDIKRAATGNSKLGAFILASCFIDHMAGFTYGNKSNKINYIKFVRDYLPPIYNPTKLYVDLRCKLVHNYSEGGSYWLKHNNPQLHGKTFNKKTIINLENFIDDLEKALYKLIKNIEIDPSVRQKAIARYKSFGLLCVGGITPREE